MKLFKGHAIVEGRKSPNSLYDEKLATYSTDDEFNHASAVGFIELMGSSNKSSRNGEQRRREGASMTKLWGGRFQKSAEQWVDEFGASIGFDQHTSNGRFRRQYRACENARRLQNFTSADVEQYLKWS